MTKPPRSRRTAAASANRPKKRSRTPAKAGSSSTQPRKAPAPRALSVVRLALEDMKALDVKEFDVRGLSDVTDYMLVASGTSDRHVKSIAERVLQSAKDSGVKAFGVEGLREGEWVLVDLPDVLVHVMLPRVRELYALEQLWAPPPARRARSKG